MGWIHSYRLRWRRRGLLWRSLRRRGQLTAVADRTGATGARDVLLFACLRNERIRLPYFLDYYRRLGVGHFLVVDNGSIDGSAEFLAGHDDVSLWRADGSYAAARFGMDWVGALLFRHGHGHWCLTVDADEFFVYPFCDTRPLPALTDWLDDCGLRSFSAMLIDMYPKGPVDETPYAEGQDPFEIAQWFDGSNYTIQRNPDLRNLWIQGGPRARAFFADRPAAAPALNKIPLVKWRRRYAYVHSTHMLLPRGLNLTYDQSGGEAASGALLHAKFLHTIRDKAAEEAERGEHYDGGREYAAYRAGLEHSPDLWTEWSERYINWRQLEILGLMSKGNWA
ncbi:glycosyltransferase family 2 protein [Rhodovulum sp. 12E13]|uniref:glycosyltransferase family 2 protein n=1 Tax=Rhodovulum sp. 12E13 TaxID=2203891 RepID=UPI000E12C987|nr:glycosyltransferase family 2 protein [Rhodovulum sp. 12E13]RDC73731.1 glycosyltransferase family 2 protein [Rhodovulum sp. 12E13]